MEVWKGKGDGLEKLRRRLENVFFFDGRKSSASVTCEIFKCVSTESWTRKKKTIMRSKNEHENKKVFPFSFNRLLIKDYPSGEQKVAASQYLLACKTTSKTACITCQLHNLLFLHDRMRLRKKGFHWTLKRFNATINRSSSKCDLRFSWLQCGTNIAYVSIYLSCNHVANLRWPLFPQKAKKGKKSEENGGKKYDHCSCHARLEGMLQRMSHSARS